MDHIGFHLGPLGYRILEMPPLSREARANFDRLPEDPYYKERWRQFSQYILFHEHDRWACRVLTHRPFIQAKAYNQKVGGVRREFEPIAGVDPTPQFATIAEALRFDTRAVFQVNLHQWRTRVDEVFQGKTIPEGPLTDIGAEEIQSLAERHGTPLFVYDDAYFRAGVSAFLTIWRDAFPTGRAYLSYKTNYMPALCRSAHALRMGADVVSGFEMEHALRLCAARDIVFNGPLKRIDELERAAREGIPINIDLAEELETLEALRSSGRITTARLGLRVNPGLPVFAACDRSFVQAHAAKQRSAKFGWPLDDGLARHMAERISASGFSFETVHAHLNSQITDTSLFLAALEPVLGFVAGLRASGTQIRELNVGGGFGVPGMQRSKRGWWSALKATMGEAPAGDPDEAFDMTAFAGALARRLREHGLDGLCISCEPGRYLMSASMALVTRVAGIKVLPEKRWVVIDGGLNILPTAAFGERRRLRFLRSGADLPQRDDDPDATLGGPLCFEGDVVMESAKVPASLAGGDLVVLSDAGAYTVSRSTNFNQLRAAVAMRDGRDGIPAPQPLDFVFANSIADFEESRLARAALPEEAISLFASMKRHEAQKAAGFATFEAERAALLKVL